MKILNRLCAALLTVGMLGAAACSSCGGAPAEDAKNDPALQQQSYRCGPNTHLEGTQCVGDTSTSSARKSQTTVLKTTGNN